jgi:hypothetical protein
LGWKGIVSAYPVNVLDKLLKAQIEPGIKPIADSRVMKASPVPRPRDFSSTWLRRNRSSELALYQGVVCCTDEQVFLDRAPSTELQSSLVAKYMVDDGFPAFRQKSPLACPRCNAFKTGSVAKPNQFMAIVVRTVVIKLRVPSVQVPHH